MRSHAPRVLLGIAVLLLLVALNQVVFAALFDESYLRWYVDNGAIIALLASVVFLVWDMNNNTELIARDPLIYGSACCYLVGTQIFSLGPVTANRKAPLLDRVAATPMLLVVAAASMLWLVLIAPIQYFVNALCGAPARMSATAPLRTLGIWKNDRLDIKAVPRSDPVPAGAVDFSLGKQPVSMTNAIAALCLFLVGLLV